jgi:DNA-binding transcriptional regulator YhcF (GntR family)
MPGALIGVSQALLAALLDGRHKDALSINERYVEACADMVRASSLTGVQRATDEAAQRAYDFLPRAKPTKKAERVEREIRDMIIAQGWPIGESLGSETELSTRFEVGRAVLREALRSLEQLGIVEMGRGGRSGLRVKSPDPATVTETCRRYLRRERLTRHQADSLRSAIEDTQVGEGARMKQLFLSVLP